jgi:hypothetical protein
MKTKEEQRLAGNAGSRKYNLAHPERKRASNQRWTKAHKDDLQKQRDLGKEERKIYQAKHVERATVNSHWHYIFNPETRAYKNYRGMPFFDSWNPNKGGSYQSGADWIIKNLGRRPEGTTMHIVDHALGFVPGNLEWTFPQKQASGKMFKIIADQRHEIKTLKERIKELEART